jgi:3-phosphoshikimate 1-carboxyvinyltransferase
MIKFIKPVAQVQARFRLPGSKSVTHRALLMAALAPGESRVVNPLRAEDTVLTARALEQLGVGIRWEDHAVRVTPPAVRWSEPRAPIHLGNSGTSLRLLVALLAAGRGRFVVDGTARLRERPIGPVLQALAGQGVSHRYLSGEGCPPVEITARGLQGGEIWIDASQSSQFLSALLIAAPCAAHDVTVGWKEAVAWLPYVHLTLAMMEQFGIQWRWAAPHQVLVPAPQRYQARSYTVEGDCSSASYWWAAAALTGGEVFTAPTSPDALQGDCRFLEILQRMGCAVRWEEDGVRVLGPERLQPVDVDMNAMPDMVPTLAIIAAFAAGQTRISNVAHLRIKESDRLQVVAMELAKLGVEVQELADALVIRGTPRHGAAIDAHDDHRIAMAFALVGLRLPGVEIHGAEAVAKSFPGFWEEFRQLSPETGP